MRSTPLSSPITASEVPIRTLPAATVRTMTGAKGADSVVTRIAVLAVSVVVGSAALTGCSGPAVSPASIAATSMPQPQASTLVLLEELGPPQLTALTIATGETEVVYSAPTQTFLFDVEVDAQSGSLFVSHAPPPNFDRSIIAQVVSPTEVAEIAGSNVTDSWLFFPALGEDALWYVQTGTGLAPGTEHALGRLDLETGQSLPLIPWGTEPSVSSDGRHLVWVAVDPVTQNRQIELGRADGTWLRTLHAPAPGFDVGLPMFSPDGTEIFFVEIPPETVTWFDAFANVLIPKAHAHNGHDRPGDWWRVAVGGSSPTRVTTMETIHYDGRVDPGGEFLFVATREGVSQVRLQTGTATSLLTTRTVRALDVLTHSSPGGIEVDAAP